MYNGLQYQIQLRLLFGAALPCITDIRRVDRPNRGHNGTIVEYDNVDDRIRDRIR